MSFLPHSRIYQENYHQINPYNNNFSYKQEVNDKSLNDYQNSLKSSLRNLYLNDINSNIDKKKNEKFQQISFEVEKNKVIENSLNNEKAIELQKKLQIKQMLLNEYNHFYKENDYKSNKNQMSLNSVYKKQNLHFYKPNELIYKNTDNSNDNSNDNINSHYKFHTSNNNKNNTVETLPKESYLISSPYKDGKTNKIYSIHKIDDNSVNLSNNFYTDNVNSLNSCHTKRKTYHVKNSSESFNKVFDPSSKFMGNKESLEEREKEFLIAKIQKQEILKKSLDMQKVKHDLFLKNNQNYLFTDNIALDPGNFILFQLLIKN